MIMAASRQLPCEALLGAFRLFAPEPAAVCKQTANSIRKAMKALFQLCLQRLQGVFRHAVTDQVLFGG